MTCTLLQYQRSQLPGHLNALRNDPWVKETLQGYETLFQMQREQGEDLYTPGTMALCCLTVENLNIRTQQIEWSYPMPAERNCLRQLFNEARKGVEALHKEITRHTEGPDDCDSTQGSWRRIMTKLLGGEYPPPACELDRSPEGDIRLPSLLQSSEKVQAFFATYNGLKGLNPCPKTRPVACQLLREIEQVEKNTEAFFSRDQHRCAVQILGTVKRDLERSYPPEDCARYRDVTAPPHIPRRDYPPRPTVYPLPSPGTPSLSSSALPPMITNSTSASPGWVTPTVGVAGGVGGVGLIAVGCYLAKRVYNWCRGTPTPRPRWV